MIIEEGEYLVYTDGSCRDRTGGWGFTVLIDESVRLCGYGGLLNCTNNQAEMMAAIMALSCFSGDNRITVVTDSKYLKDGMSSRVYVWESNGYKTATRGKVKNKPLWKDLYNLQLEQAPHWEWVKGHSGDIMNDLVDNLALRGRSYAEQHPINKRDQETTLHNFFKAGKDQRSKDCLMYGAPKIYLEEY